MQLDHYILLRSKILHISYSPVCFYKLEGGMKHKCEGCRAVNEEIYWTHFNTMHFCQFLTRDFRTRLMIPKKFADCKKGELNEKLVIKGPSGVTWEVSLLTNGNILYFGDGWEEFVSDHTLEQNDILIFKYRGNSHFDVVILDRRSLCEKEESYFVRNCEHKKPHAKLMYNDNSAKKPRKEAVLEVTEYSGPYPMLDHDNDDKIQAQETVVALRSVTPLLGNQVCLAGDEPLILKKRSNCSAVTCASSRRSISEAEKRAVFHKAIEELTDDGFIVVMRATHVHKKFFVSVPAGWLTKHVIQESGDVILRTEEKSWEAKLLFDNKGRGGLARGWKDFAMDNSLEEYDVCLFKLANRNPKHKSVTFDVNIFRVVPDGVPLLCEEPDSPITISDL